MRLPPDLKFARVDIGTPAAANTDGGPSNLIGGPGAGFRTRLWVVSYQANSAAHPAHNWMMAFIDSLTANTDIRLADAYPAPGTLTFPGGFALAPNGVLQVIYRASIAGPMFYRAMAWYTTEAVS